MILAIWMMNMHFEAVPCPARKDWNVSHKDPRVDRKNDENHQDFHQFYGPSEDPCGRRFSLYVHDMSAWHGTSSTCIFIMQIVFIMVINEVKLVQIYCNLFLRHRYRPRYDPTKFAAFPKVLHRACSAWRGTEKRNPLFFCVSQVLFKRYVPNNSYGIPT